MTEDRRAQEELLILQEEMLRRKQDDPWWKWEPTPRQAPFIHDMLTGECEEGWMFAANRSGKSDAAAFIAASLARFGQQCPRFETPNPQVHDGPTTGWIISVTHNNSIEVIQPKLFNNGLSRDPGHSPFIPEREIVNWNATNQILTLRNGSSIGFKSADSGALKMAGASKDWIMFDEEPPKNVYDEAVIRIAAGRRLLVFGACTLLPPEGQTGGVSWMYPEKIKPWKNGNPVSWRIYTASIYENPHLSPLEIKRLESIYPVGSTSRAIRLNGELLPGLAGSRCYSSFINSIHVLPQGEPASRRPICWMWDFNVEPLITLVGQRHGDTFKIYRELVLEDDGNIDEMCQMFREAYPNPNSEVWIYGDATGKARSVGGGGRSEYQLITNAMRKYGMTVRIKVPETNPLVNDRVNAVNASFRDSEGVPRIEIDPSCTELIDDFEGVLRDNRNGILKTHNRRDPYCRRTHSSDAFGYWIAYEKPVRLVQSPGYAELIRNAIKQPKYGFGKRN